MLEDTISGDLYRDEKPANEPKSIIELVKSGKLYIDEPAPIGDYVTNLTTEELIDIKWNPNEYSDTLCNMCADAGCCTDAEMDSHDMELCFDCYHTINDREF